MRRSIRRLLVPVLTAAALLSAVPGVAAADADPGVTLQRWFGAEGHWDETACATFGACAGWTTSRAGKAGIGTSESNHEWRDPDGALRPWPARTGRYFYIFGVGDAGVKISKGEQPVQIGTVPSNAYLTSFGTTLGGFPGGTVAFAFRIHTVPEEPVVIFRHRDADPLNALTLTLGGDGTSRGIIAAALGMAGETRPVDTDVWHTVTLSYGLSESRFTLRLDGNLEIDSVLPLGAPSGDINVGIASPMTTEFVIGFDDYVESSEIDAPIGGARINYLIPLGSAGAEQWQKQYPSGPCLDAARNWQLVSENQSVRVPDVGNGNPGRCELGGGVGAAAPNLVDEYVTEGIPSAHQPTPSYARDLTIHPAEGDAILGVRLRMAGITSNPFGLEESWRLGFVDEGRLVEDSFSFTNGGTGGAVTQWGPTHPLRSNGEPWDVASLGSATLRLHSGEAPISHRSTSGVRLDYVWVPAA